MAIGRKSIVTKCMFPNNKDSKKIDVVLIQANKHYGICDILRVVKTADNEPGKKIHMSEVLSIFQGRQLNDSDVLKHLWNVLNEILNPVEE